MGLSEAKRALQWNVVMEAITAAGVDDDIIKMVEAARDASTLIHGLTGMLLGGADKQAAKNYVKFEMVGLIAPFERAYVELVRPDGKTSHELRELLRDRLEHVRALLSKGPPADVLRQGLIEGIDEDLAKESPSPTKVEVVSGRVDGVVVCQPGAKQFIDEAPASPDVAEAIRRWPERVNKEKCLQCGHEMVSKLENRLFRSVPRVVLVGVPVSRCPSCGDYEVAIRAIDELNSTIAGMVADNLTPFAARFEDGRWLVDGE